MSIINTSELSAKYLVLNWHGISYKGLKECKDYLRTYQIPKKFQGYSTPAYELYLNTKATKYINRAYRKEEKKRIALFISYTEESTNLTFSEYAGIEIHNFICLSGNSYKSLLKKHLYNTIKKDKVLRKNKRKMELLKSLLVPQQEPSNYVRAGELFYQEIYGMAHMLPRENSNVHQK